MGPKNENFVEISGYFWRLKSLVQTYQNALQCATYVSILDGPKGILLDSPPFWRTQSWSLYVQSNSKNMSTDDAMNYCLSHFNFHVICLSLPDIISMGEERPHHPQKIICMSLDGRYATLSKSYEMFAFYILFLSNRYYSLCGIRRWLRGHFSFSI